MKKVNINAQIPHHLNLDYYDKYIVLLDDMHQAQYTRESILNESFITMLVDEGRCSVVINDTMITLEKGDMLACAPGNVLQRDTSTTDFRCKIFIMSSEHVNSILKGTHMSMSHYLTNKIVEVLHLTQEEQNMFNGFYRLISSFKHMPQDEVREECVCKILQSLSYAFVGLFFHRGAIYRRDRGTSAESLFRKFIQLLKDYPQGRTVQFYAEKLNITPKYFNTICKQVSGKTASTLINEEIVNAATLLLADLDLSIKQISSMLGFANQSHFGSFMRRETGVSPQSIRKKQQK